MIPKKLRLKNFLSYGETLQELDFDLFSLAVITGKNGAGKSSLVEAIPFCLWGDGRAKNVDLLRRGSREAHLEFEFELKGHLYRITRKLARERGNVKQEVSFAIYDEAAKGYRAIGGATLMSAQAEIDRRIGISRDAFMHSAFFGQGEADKLMEATPARRREILAEILGLHRYEALSEKAGEKAKATAQEIEKDKCRIETLKERVGDLVELRGKIKAKQAEQVKAEERLTQLQAERDAIERRLQVIGEKEIERKTIDEQIRSLDEEIQRETQLINEKEEEIRAIDKRLAKRPELERKRREAETLKKELEELDDKRQRAQSVKDDIARHENEFNQNKARLEAEKKAATQQLDSLAKLIADREAKLARKPDLLQKQQTLQERLTALAKDAERLPNIEADLNEARQNIASLKADLDSLQKQMKEIEKKGKQVKELGDVCPLCQSPLDDKHKNHVIEIYRDDYRALQKQKKEKDESRELEEEQAKRLQAELDALKKKEKEKNEADSTLKVLNNELKTLETLERELAQFKAQKSLHEEKLKECDANLQASRETLTKIKSLQAKLAEIGYDAETHQRKKSELKEFEKIPDELARLDADEKIKAQLQRDVAERKKRIQTLAKEVEQKEGKVKALKREISEKDELGQKRDALSQEIKKAEADREEIKAELKFLERSLKEKTEDQNKKERLEKEIAPKQERADCYGILEKAFGKNGLQHLLLERAVPEIQRRANEWLSRLTNNLFSLSVKTQTEGDRPTLQIIISDAAGETRDYKTFSGGERFRVDFSLRLALSQYLAQLSGTPVKLLVIDEGFGSQDDEGIDAMVEAIKEVSQASDMFAKVLVISHLERMKEGFPTRINVTKDARSGSRFEVAL